MHDASTPVGRVEVLATVVNRVRRTNGAVKNVSNMINAVAATACGGKRDPV